MILKKFSDDKTPDILLNEKRYVVIPDQINLKHISLEAASGIFIKTNNVSRVDQVLGFIRRSMDPKIYLLPIFVNSKLVYTKRKNELDGYLLDQNYALMSSKSSDILERIYNIKKDLTFTTENTEIILVKLLQWAYTRNKIILPFNSRFSPIGYQLPFLSTIINNHETLSVFLQLQQLAKKSYVNLSVLDRINLCHSCESSYLNFHETCSKCKSLDLHYENLIHHFRCAYIGPESDFKHDDQMICPKCDKELKHIGIDYDKPSEIAHCHHCDHTSQETHMQARCVDCGTKNELSQLSSHDIHSFTITSIGEHWICNDILKEDDHEKLRDLRLVPKNIFNLLVEQEKNRVKNKSSQSSFLAEFRIDLQLFIHLNTEFKDKLKDEICDILIKYSREIDVVTASDYAHYRLLFPDIKQNNSLTYYEMILDNLNKILSDNMKKGEKVVSGELKQL